MSFQNLFRTALILLLSPFFAVAQTVRDLSLEPRATLDSSVPSITLQWNPAPAGSAVTDLLLSKRVWAEDFNASSSGPRSVGTLPLNATSFTDTSFFLGDLYEYYLVRSPGGSVFIPVGVEVPWQEHRGGVLLVLDSTLSTTLQADVNTLI